MKKKILIFFITFTLQCNIFASESTIDDTAVEFLSSAGSFIWNIGEKAAVIGSLVTIGYLLAWEVESLAGAESSHPIKRLKKIERKLPKLVDRTELQNVVKRDEVAKMVKETVEASENIVVVSPPSKETIALLQGLNNNNSATQSPQLGSIIENHEMRLALVEVQLREMQRKEGATQHLKSLGDSKTSTPIKSSHSGKKTIDELRAKAFKISTNSARTASAISS